MYSGSRLGLNPGLCFKSSFLYLIMFLPFGSLGCKMTFFIKTFRPGVVWFIQKCFKSRKLFASSNFSKQFIFKSEKGKRNMTKYIKMTLIIKIPSIIKKVCFTRILPIFFMYENAWGTRMFGWSRQGGGPWSTLRECEVALRVPSIRVFWAVSDCPLHNL